MSDPSALTTAALQREIAHLSDRIDLKIEGVVSSIGARLDAIDRATQVFSENLVRVPTETQKAVGNLQALTEERFSSAKAKVDEQAQLQSEKLNSVQRQFSERDVRVEQVARDTRIAIDAALKASAAVLDEQFRSIQTQFIERDTRVEQTARDTRVAVDAALQAAEKAVGKQNESFALSIAKSETATQKQIDQIGSLVNSAIGAVNGKIDDLKERLTRLEGTNFGTAGQKQEQHQTSGMTIAVIGLGITILLALFAAFAFIQRIPAAPNGP